MQCLPRSKQRTLSVPLMSLHNKLLITREKLVILQRKYGRYHLKQAVKVNIIQIRQTDSMHYLIRCTAKGKDDNKFFDTFPIRRYDLCPLPLNQAMLCDCTDK